jgi:hypothetical protein
MRFAKRREKRSRANSKTHSSSGDKMTTESRGAEGRKPLRERAETAYYWLREWVGELDDIALALMVYALAGIWLLYSI